MPTELKQKAEQIAIAMGPEWILSWRYDHLFHLNCAVADDTKGLSIRLEGKRLYISGIWPAPIRDDGNQLSFHPYSGVPKNISVDPDRDAEAIAKDIKRRFVPKYLARYDELYAGKLRQLDIIEQKEGLVRELSMALGLKPNGSKCHLPHGNGASGRVEVRVTDDEATVAFDVSHVPVEVAMKIAVLLRKE